MNNLGNLEDMVRAANDRYEAMTYEQKAAMWRKQRMSWVIGEMLLEHPHMSRERAQALYDRVILP